jgi:acylphosphatase
MKDRKQARFYVVRGRVQGVGFRYFVERAAARLSVGGYVRNRADGSVEVLAVGGASQLEKLSQALRKGPPIARVDDVEESEAASEPVTGFQVRY